MGNDCPVRYAVRPDGVHGVVKVSNNELIHGLCGHIIEQQTLIESLEEDLDASNVALAVADKEIDFLKQQLALRPFHVQD